MAIASHHPSPFSIRSVPMTRPFIWLGRAWDDLLHHCGASLAHGWLISTLGVLILAYERHPLFIAFTISVFLLVGPIITAGLCELSRRQENGDTADFAASLRGLRGHRHNLLGFANRLLALGIGWFALTALALYIATNTVAPSLNATVGGDVLRQITDTQLLFYVVSGGILGALVFALSVVTIPMIVDSNVNPHTAMGTSFRVTMRDLPAMLVWAGLIVALVGIGFVTYLVGMIVIFPLLGHATWHAYRDLVH